jgi:hypothetical protein
MQTPTITAGASPAKSEASSLRLIKKLHGSILHAARTSLDSAIRIGELLSKIKASKKHGDWQSWAERHLPFDVRTARNYCRCFEERDRLKTETVSDLTSAYKFLAESKTEPADADFKTLDSRIRQSFADVREAISSYPDASELPPTSGMDARVTESGFDDFIREQRIILGDGDLIPLMVIGEAFKSGGSLPAETILEILHKLNPARTEVLAA